MESSNNQANLTTSNLKRVMVILAAQISADPQIIINRLLNEDHAKLLNKFMPMLAMVGIPKPDTMIETIANKLADLPTDFWLMIEDYLLAVIEGDREAEQRLFDWINGVKPIEHSD